MDSSKLIVLFVLTCLFTVNCKPIKKRQSWYTGCGSEHFAPLPAIIAERAEFAPLPQRYAEPMPIPKPLPAFGYEFTVPVPPPNMYRGCAQHDTIHIPPPPPPAVISAPCLETPSIPIPPPPPAELPIPTPVHTEPCFDTSPLISPTFTAPAAPIITEPIALPPPPPSHIITEPLKTPDCFEAAPLPPVEIEHAPLPPHATFTEPCHGAAPAPAPFAFPSAPLDMTHYGGLMTAGEGYPEVLDAKH